MKIYDISQELFGSVVFPGDPMPEKNILMRKSEGDVCNLSALKMCAHNGTHVDAPFHFIDDGKTVDQIDLYQFVGYAYVAKHEGELTADDAMRILERGKEAGRELHIEKQSELHSEIYSELQRNLSRQNENDSPANRILIRGNAVVTKEAARVFADNHILLFGNESQTVGPEEAPMEVHMIMLGAGIVLLEGIRLGEVEEGVYLLNAAPINLGGADGAPCRAILIQTKEDLCI